MSRQQKSMKNGKLYRHALTYDSGFTVNPSFPIRNYNHAFATRTAQLIARHIFKLRLDQMQIATSGFICTAKLIDDIFNWFDH